MSLVVAGVTDLLHTGTDALGDIFAGSLEKDGSAVRVRLLGRSLSDDELLSLSSPVLASPPHSALAAIIDVGRTADSRPYVVIDADVPASLADRRDRGEWLSPREGAELLFTSCAALTALHARGRVYGTVTPESVAQASDGWRLVDAGLATVTVPLPPARDVTLPTVLAYTAPEVLAGSPCDPASDVFSLAATVVELLTGFEAAPRWPPAERATTRAERFRAVSGLPEGLRRSLEASLDPVAARRPGAAALQRCALSSAAKAQPARAQERSPHAEVLDDDVQFTVYRPHSVHRAAGTRCWPTHKDRAVCR